MPKGPTPPADWTCPLCGRTYPLKGITEAQRAMLDLLAHLIGHHQGYPPE